MHFEGNLTKTFLLAIALNVAFVAIEFTYGFIAHSLSLMADAWHNLGDVAGLALSLLALRMAGLKPTTNYTYGYSKGTILASLSNSVLLLLAVGSIGYESVHRFYHPVAVHSGTISLVAGIGVVINTLTALLFIRKQELNSRAAFLHMAADALVSVAVVLGGFAISYTGFNWIDPLLGILVCIVILAGTWKLLKSSLRLSLDGVPEDLNIAEIEKLPEVFPAIKDIHHLHVWALSTTKNAMTAHILLQKSISDEDLAELKKDIKHHLQHLNIHHATLEFETRHTDDPEECMDC